MRKYPKRCPKCNEFMEPKFSNDIGIYGMNNYSERSTTQEPDRWECDCGHLEEHNLELKCKVCNKKAKYEEFSPDGPKDYFCSKKHHREYALEQHSKGLFWRAGGLSKI